MKYLSILITIVSALSYAQTPTNPFISHAKQITFSGPRAGEGYFSADGESMIFQSERSAENPFYQIFVMNLKTGKSTRLSPGYGQTTCGWIHPDNKKAMWSSTHLDSKWKQTQDQEVKERQQPVKKRYSWSYDPHYDIFESDLTGKKIKQLTKAFGYDAEGSYSPDGKWIAFASNRTGYEGKLSDDEKKLFEKDPSSQMEIYIMRADGSDVRRLTRSLGYDGGPFFSADGKHLTWRRFSADGATAEIWTMKVDGSEQKQITRLGKLSWAPYFHPSGDYIIFASNIEGHSNFELYIVDSAGQKDPVRVTFEPGFDGLATFSPDGSTLSWTRRNEKGESQIYMGQWSDEAARKALGLPQARFSLPVLSSDLKKSDLTALVKYLASPEMEGRSTGSAQEKIYTAQIASLFKSWGLVPAPGFQDFFQEFEFTSGIRFGNNNRLEFTGNLPESKKDTTEYSEKFEPLSLSKNGVVESAPIVFAGYGLRAPATDKIPAYDSYEGLDVKGKWVLVLQDVPQDVPQEQRFHFNQFGRLEFKASVAKAEGAVGLLVVKGPHTQMIEKWGSTPRLEGSPLEGGLAVIKIRTQVGDELFASQGLKLADVQKNLDSLKEKKGFEFKNLKAEAQVDLILEKSKGRNVVGVLRAAGPAKKLNTAVLVGAHGDHLGFGQAGSSLAKAGEENQAHLGADDNASGVSVVMELAHNLSAQKNNLKKDVYFAVWSGEELGILGSKAWADEFKKKHGDLNKTIAAQLNLDMVGRLKDQLIVQSVGSSNLWPPLFEELSLKSGLAMTLQEDPYLPTDSTTFYLNKIPSITFFTGAHSEYHSPRDKADLLNYEGLLKVAEVAKDWIQSTALTKDKISFRDVPQSRKSTGNSSRSFKIFLGTIPDYAKGDGKGVKLSGISQDSPAQKGGLQAGDLIIEMAGQKIDNLYDYTYVLQSLKAGSEVPVKVMRAGSLQELKITPALKE